MWWSGAGELEAQPSPYLNDTAAIEPPSLHCNHSGCHGEEPFGYAQDKLRDEAISNLAGDCFAALAMTHPFLFFIPGPGD
jgi:hypothetical protein